MADELKYCHHCNKFLSRWTVLRHSKHFSCVGESERSPGIDRKRRRRQSGSSADEHEHHNVIPNDDSVVEPVAQEILITEQEDTTPIEEVGDEEHWDDESEEEINRDLSDVQEESEEEKSNRAKSIVSWILCSLMCIQSKFNLSDKCIEVLLLLFKQLFLVLSVVNILCFSISTLFPFTLYMYRKILKFDRDDFTKLIVCPNCTSVYRFGQVVQERDGAIHVSRCTNKVFGCRLPKESKNKGKRGKYKCDAELVQRIKLKNDKEKYYPIKVFCYKSVISSLESLLSRPDFHNECSKWRNRDARNFYGDIYDGKVWHDFQTYQGQPLLSDPNNYAAMINVDWFQPFKRRSDYSVGVVYLVILNLPRSLRFQINNVCLLGIIPAMKKEPDNLNSFLGPIVKELQILSRGIQIQPKGKDSVFVKLHLLCASSDIPAARKLSGHMGHAALRGCSFCEMTFRDEDGNKYYAPVSSSCSPRNREKHVYHARRAENAATHTKQRQIHKESGYKFTKLLDLEYFIPSKFTVVEPMHNLFLGTAKKCFSYWIDHDYISKRDLDLISERVRKMKVAADLGRVPSNISSNHGQFTAEEWKNWVLVFSMYCLQGILPGNHLKTWQKFVLACRIICQPAIPKQRTLIAHTLFLKFSREVEQLYGSEFLTPNIHLHGHLKETIENYGSLYGFWAFSFERYNGVLADFQTNKRSVEIQIMRKFHRFGFTADLQNRNGCDVDLNALLGELDGNKCNKTTPTQDVLTATIGPIQGIEHFVWHDLSSLTLRHSGYKLMTLSSMEQCNLLCVYKKLYDVNLEQGSVTKVAKVYPSILWMNEMLGSSSSCRGENSSIVLAKWAANDCTLDDTGVQRPGVVRYFLLHNAEINGKIFSHLFAFVDWLKQSENQLGYLPPLSVWSTKQMNDGPASFLPIQRVHSKCAVAKEKRGNQTFMVVSAYPPRLYL